MKPPTGFDDGAKVSDKIGVIQNLVLDAQQLLAVVLHPILDATVAFGRNFKLEPQFEVAVFLPRDDVAAFTRKVQDAPRFQLPSGGHGITGGLHPMTQ